MKIYYLLVGWKSRINYWGCSTFAERCRKLFGIDKKPGAATSEEWIAWEEKNIKTHPISYWVIETLFNNLQDVVNFPNDVYRNFKHKFHNTFISKSHFITTNLKPGEWYDCDTKIREGLFTLLIDFVEQEKADVHRYAYFNDDEPKSNREDGIAHLDWEIALDGESPQQAESAKEIKEIYIWLKDIRPNRPEPNDITGWSKHCDAKRKNGSSISLLAKEKTKEGEDKVKKILNELRSLEQQYDDEDTEILIRIIKIRKHLWT